MVETDNIGGSESSPEDQPTGFSSGFTSGEEEGNLHLLGIFGFVGPLLIWLIERDKHRFVDEHGRAAMNYQISFLIYLTALSITVIGLFLVPVLLVIHIALSIVGTVKASRGEPWHYPIAIGFLK